ncbi:MAG: hypothetical protein LBG48_01235 [Rickettsiales bacterium]|jgi:hypothetical protein|nr:hypothetical protein [Rickettsiales bacterium]
MKNIVNTLTVVLLTFTIGFSNTARLSANSISGNFINIRGFELNNRVDASFSCSDTAVLLTGIFAVLVSAIFATSFYTFKYVTSRHSVRNLRCNSDCQELNYSDKGETIFLTEECVCYNETLNSDESL